ncbi:MAG: BamA/TamA family outer membrane protein [Gemmatimonadota bacterium]|nr:BamA/TamA family outer membrane protein [Gemmatimonadota bacterium]
MLPRLRRDSLVGRAAAMAVSSLLLAVPSGAQSKNPDKDQREAPEVRSVVAAGVKGVNRSDLLRALATQPSVCRSIVVKPFCILNHSHLWWQKHYLDRTELKRDVLRAKVFYFKHGFRFAQVDTSVSFTKGGVRVRFAITEGRPTLVSVIRVTQRDSVLADRTIKRLMLLRAGKPLDLLALDSSLVLLRSTLWDAGYSDAVLDDSITVGDSARIAQVEVRIDPRWKARIGQIDIRGNEHISRRTIMNSITLRPGNSYRRTDVLESQQNLYESSLFRTVQIIIPPTGDTVKQLTISVREAPLTEVRTSVGFNTIDYLQAEQRLTRYNWLGGGRRLDVRGVVGNLLGPQLDGVFPFRDAFPGQAPELRDSLARTYLTPTWQASADVTQPWFRSPRNSLGVSVFTHRRSAPLVFVDNGYGTSASFTRQIADRVPLSLSYRFEVTRVGASDVYFCVNFGVCESRTIEALKGHQRLSPLSLGGYVDRTNDLFAPTGGYNGRIELEHASAYTASSFRYNRAEGSLAEYWSLSPTLVVAMRGRSGWVRALASTGRSIGETTTGIDIIHPRKRFYAGGSSSVRGYGETQLGPKVLTVDAKELLSRGCDPAAPAACSPTVLDSIPASRFVQRPLGGTSLLEGSVELRFPLPIRHLGGAVFLDGGFVGSGALRDVASGEGALTPGFGFRFFSSAGVIRADLGIRPSLVENRSVITETIDASGAHRIVQLPGIKHYDPLKGASGIRQVLDRLTLHLSLGQAF